MAMNLTSQQTFVDRINEAEMAVTELSRYADRLASRLVGYADTEKAFNDEVPSSGILSDVGITASRILRAAGDIRSHLRRIEESLPAETAVASAGYQAGLGAQTGLR